jgi:membrane protein DedA with SNARE-associated domain
MIGALIGDTITFTIGRFFKKFALSWLNKHPDKKKLAENLIRQYGAFVIIFERFIYGTHIPVMLIFGMIGYSYIKFFIYEIIGTFLWAITFTSIGYFFGKKAIEFMIVIQKDLVGFLFLILIIILFIKNKGN